MTLYNRPIKNHKVFPAEPGQYGAWYAAIAWLKNQGYSCGKLDYPGPTAFMAGKYNLPLKWNDLSTDQRATVAGIISSRDPKNCAVNVYFFE